MCISCKSTFYDNFRLDTREWWGPYYNVGYVVRVLSDLVGNIVIVRRLLVKMVRNAY